MPDLQFGVKTGQGGYSYEDLLKVWTAAEELGYESAWLYDHFYSLGDKNQPCLEAWTTLAALATMTKRLKLGTMVTCVNYRHPSLLAKMGATIDLLSHGRLILGIGAGWYEEEYRAYGYDFPDQATRMKQLKEALIIIQKLWTEENATFEGNFYTIRNAISSPKPMQRPRPKILVGITSGRKTLPFLAVRYADGLNATSSSLAEVEAVIHSALGYCEKLGKKKSELIISWQGFLIIGETDFEVEAYLEKGARRRGQSVSEFRKTILDRGFILGPPDVCAERLRKFKDLGVKNFFLGFIGDTEIRPLETFRDRVIPQLR
jgi:F420-dependent oxidoreductase-like protein